MKIFLRKLPGSILIPDTEEEKEKLGHIKTNDVVYAEIKHPRNYKFHKKFFAMLKVGYDAWEPAEQEYKGLPVQKNFDRFREDIFIAAGFGEVVLNIRGEARARAKSISFGSMGQEEFDKLYNAVADVLLQKILKTYTKDDLESVVNEIAGFLSTM